MRKNKKKIIGKINKTIDSRKEHDGHENAAVAHAVERRGRRRSRPCRGTSRIMDAEVRAKHAVDRREELSLADDEVLDGVAALTSGVTAMRGMWSAGNARSRR